MEENKLNVYGKLQRARVLMQEEGLKKNGKNTFSKYSYFTIDALYPSFNRVLDQVGLFSHMQITEQIGVLTIIDIDNPKDEIIFSLPVIKADLKGSTAIQELGATNSYIARYLLMNAMQIAEEIDDRVDSTEQSEARSPKNSKSKAKVEKEPVGDDLESLKNEVTELCKEISTGGGRAKVAEIVKANNNNNMNPKSITDVEVAKKILEELKAIK